MNDKVLEQIINNELEWNEDGLNYHLKKHKNNPDKYLDTSINYYMGRLEATKEIQKRLGLEK